MQFITVIHLDDNTKTLHDFWFYCYDHFKTVRVLSYSRPAKVFELISLLEKPFPSLFVGKLNMDYMNGVETVRQMDKMFVEFHATNLPFAVYLYTDRPDYTKIEDNLRKPGNIFC